MKANGRILIVDDDELMGAMLSRTLKNSGYEVRVKPAQPTSPPR